MSFLSVYMGSISSRRLSNKSNRCCASLSSISSTGGTPGWLWNLRPGTRSFGPLRGPASQRAGRPGRAYPPPDPRKWCLLYACWEFCPHSRHQLAPTLTRIGRDSVVWICFTWLWTRSLLRSTTFAKLQDTIAGPTNSSISD
jgi:hypothetical protein